MKLWATGDLINRGEEMGKIFLIPKSRSSDLGDSLKESLWSLIQIHMKNIEQRVFTAQQAFEDNVSYYNENKAAMAMGIKAISDAGLFNYRGFTSAYLSGSEVYCLTGLGDRIVEVESPPDFQVNRNTNESILAADFLTSALPDVQSINAYLDSNNKEQILLCGIDCPSGTVFAVYEDFSITIKQNANFEYVMLPRFCAAARVYGREKLQSFKEDLVNIFKSHKPDEAYHAKLQQLQSMMLGKTELPDKINFLAASFVIQLGNTFRPCLSALVTGPFGMFRPSEDTIAIGGSNRCAIL
jgi:hypothetical protein